MLAIWSVREGHDVRWQSRKTLKLRLLCCSREQTQHYDIVIVVLQQRTDTAPATLPEKPVSQMHLKDTGDT